MTNKKIVYQIPYAMGDVVKETKPSAGRLGYSNEKGFLDRRMKQWEKDDKGRVHIIREAQLDGDGGVSYTTSHGAWYLHEQFVLVRKADQASMAELHREDEEEDTDLLEKDD